MYAKSRFLADRQLKECFGERFFVLIKAMGDFKSGRKHRAGWANQKDAKKCKMPRRDRVNYRGNSNVIISLNPMSAMSTPLCQLVEQRAGIVLIPKSQKNDRLVEK